MLFKNKERAFFMATVAQAKILHEARAVMRQVTGGTLSPAQARRNLRVWLDQHGYQPLRGLENTIKDLSQEKRLKVSVDTNVAMARGWALRQESLQDVTHPAWRLFRTAQARKPREWDKLWKEAANAVGWEGVNRKTEEPIALISSPIWVALSEFKNPYPPFKWGSHMSVKQVPLQKCIEIGLIDSPEEAEEDMAQIPPSLNENTAVDVSAWEQDILEQVMQQCKGLVERDRDAAGNLFLRMTDLNGTRPGSPAEIAKLISTKDVPANIPKLQERAYQDWVEDSDRFNRPPEDYEDLPKGRQNIVSLNEKEDMIRLINRIISEDHTIALSRGLHFDTMKDIRDFDRLVRKKGYSAKPGKIGDSFSTNPQNTLLYAEKTNFQAIIKCRKHKSMKDFRPFYDTITPKKEYTDGTVRTEAEFILPAGKKLKIIAKREEWLPLKKKKKGIKRITYWAEEE